MAEKEYSDVEKAIMTANQDSYIRRWGERITRSGGAECKGGAYSYPGALDRYEKALGLKPAEAWLMKRIIASDWEGKGYMFYSFHGWSEEADISYGEILELKKSLEEKGYIRDMGQHRDGSFSQVHDYSFKGLLQALDYAILCDPTTEYHKIQSKRVGHPYTMADIFHYSSGSNEGKPFEPFREFTTPRQVIEYNLKNGHVTPWEAGTTQPLPKPQKRKPVEHTCSGCGNKFMSGSRNPATRCPKCRKIAKRQSLKPLITS